jgi:glycosyltransferase involved in cell wall biosynthesis
MKLPKVSVLIPTYNQENIIQETLYSALEQDYDNLEVVVADDASTDGTPQILLEFEKKFTGRLKVYLHDENLGVTRNHTRGLQQCTGEFITFLDGDDLYLPGKIRRQVDFMMKNPSCGLCYHDVDVFNSETEEVLYSWSKRFGRKKGKMKDLIRYGNFVPSVSVMVRSKDLPDYGYDDRIRIASDWMLWLDVLAKGGGMGYIDKIMARYRRHDSNMTNAWPWKFEDQLITLGLVVAKWPQFANVARLRQSEINLINAVYMVLQKNYGKAFHLLINSFVLGLPSLFPGLRLIWREVFIRHEKKNKQDDILGGVIKPAK